MTFDSDDLGVISEEPGEADRVQALYRYEVLDTPPEESFDRITRLAKAALQVPIVLVSLIDRDRQWFKSRQGLDCAETPRDISFCTHAIRSTGAMVVTDALQDARFRDNPLVVGPPHIRFYMGAPLRTHDGFNIGTLCAIDTVPRPRREDEVAVMEDLARLVVDGLELRQLAAVDSLTGALTRRSFLLRAERVFTEAQGRRPPLACVSLDIDHFKQVNDRWGHPAGDLVIRDVVAACRRIIRAVDFIGRLGGEEFSVVLPRTGIAGAELVAERLRKEIETSTSHPGLKIRVTASLGITEAAPSDTRFDEILQRADAALYCAKSAGRNCVRLAGTSL